MFSICIPVYNYDARPLVTELQRQVERLQEGTIEILLYDDGSQARYKALNRELKSIPIVRYAEELKNIGWTGIKNKMAAEAHNSTLIFLDVDSMPNGNYLENYLQKPDTTVIVGGRNYTATPPVDPALHLHWKYGRERETISPARSRTYLHFQSSNFRVDREFFLEHPFPVIDGYGHEDTLWGQLLAPTQIDIVYIDNPVTHLGLEATDRFLVKQRQALESLRLLRKQHPTLTTRLTKFVDRYPRMVQLAEMLPEKMLLDYVTRTHNLRALDLLKVKWWVTHSAPAIGYR